MHLSSRCWLSSLLGSATTNSTGSELFLLLGPEVVNIIAPQTARRAHAHHVEED
jgi:hypothetical protein